jgi:hypothetical protein
MGPVLCKKVKGLLNLPFEHLVFQPPGSSLPRRSTDCLDACDDSFDLVQFALVLVLEDPKANAAKRSLVFVESAIVSDGLSK